MSERNVEALRAVLDRMPGLVVAAPDLDTSELAAELARRGVLAVDSLTDEQATWCLARPEWASPDQLRAALRRLATGEQE